MQSDTIIKRINETVINTAILIGILKIADVTDIIINILNNLLTISNIKALLNICIYFTDVFKYSCLLLSFLAYPANINKSAIHSIINTNTVVVIKIT